MLGNILREGRPNPNGEIRTIEEAVQIAKSDGVQIPEEVQFYPDEAGELHADLTARGLARSQGVVASAHVADLPCGWPSDERDDDFEYALLLSRSESGAAEGS